MAERSGPAALEEWARNATKGYKGVSIKNMTTSWRNGLAFCAVIHRYHPKLIDYDSLNEADIIGNCALAFDVAERKLGVPALLDPEDMAAMEIPDRLSVLTYVSTLYSALRNDKKRSALSPTNPVGKKPRTDMIDGVHGKDADDIIEAARANAKRPNVSSRNVCNTCRNPVFLSERVMFAKKLYHKSCLRCTNCDTVLNQQTADISPDGKLFCLDRQCQRKLQELTTPTGRKSSRASVSDIKLWEKPKKVTTPVDMEVKEQNQSPVFEDQKSVIRDTGPDVKPITEKKSVIGAHILAANERVKSRLQELESVSSQDEDSEKAIVKVNNLRAMWEQKINDNDGITSESSKATITSSSSFRSRINLKAFIEDGYTNQSNGSAGDCNDSGNLAEEALDLNCQSSSTLAAGNSMEFVSNSTSEGPPNANFSAKDHDVVKESANVALSGSTTIPESNEEANVERHENDLPSPGCEPELKEILLEEEPLCCEENEKVDQVVQEVKRRSTVEEILLSIPPGIPDVDSSLKVVNTNGPSQDKVDILETISQVHEECNAETTQNTVSTDSKESPVSLDKLPERDVVSIREMNDVNLPEEEDQPVESRSPGLEEEPASELNESGESDTSEFVVGQQMSSTMRDDAENLKPFNEDNISQSISVEDTLRIEDITDEKPRSRSVSFSEVVEVAKIDSVTDSEIVVKEVESSAPEAETSPNVLAQSIDVEPSPETKRKNTIEFLKENIASIPKTTESVSELNPFLTDDEEDGENDDTSEVVSRNESGVGDSLQSDAKSETASSNLSIGDSKDRVPVGSDSEYGAKETHSVNMIGAQGETVPPPKPVPRTRSNHSRSPSRDMGNTPKPTPRKRISTNEIFKTKDYYPAELNPFESEDQFTLQPSDILVVKRTPSKEKLDAYNPFEEDDDENSSLKEAARVKAVVKSAEAVNGSTRSRYGKSRHAPLPPSFTSPQKVKQREKGPAPPPPVKRTTPGSEPSSNAPSLSGSEKKVIPAPPDLLKGLTPRKTNSTRKKRRAPPPRRYVPALPEDTIKTELQDLSIQESELERQGVALEANIRKLMDLNDPKLEEQIDEMVIQLWNIVNEKNDILRRQTELDYLRRGHRLEEMQADVEFRLRTLIETPVDQREDDHELFEKELLEELLHIVDERNEVVDWLDYHRQNDQEEDVYVSSSLSSFSSLNRMQTPPLVMPILSESDTKDTSLNESSGSIKDKTKHDGKPKKERFKLNFFTLKKKKKSKKADEDESIAEAAKS